VVQLFTKDSADFEKRMALKGLDGKKLASNVNVTRQYISLIKNGRRPVGNVTASKIANELDAETDEIFFTKFVDKSYTRRNLNG